MTARAGIFIWIVVFGTIGAFGYSRQNFVIQEAFICAIDKVRSDEPAANILFLGSSRMGAAIDLVYIQNQMALHLDDPDITVERLAILSSWPTQYSTLIREYVANRGAPDLVIFLPTYAVTDKSIFHGTPLFNERTEMMADLGTLSDVQARFLENDNKPSWKRLSQAGWNSTPERWLYRTTNYILSALKYPLDTLTGEQNHCSPSRKDSLARRKVWPYNVVTDVNEPFSNPDAKLMSPENILLAEEVSGNHLPFDPRDPVRRFEAAEIRDVVDIFHAEGTVVYFTIIPSFGRTEVFPDTLAGLNEVFPDVPFIDSYPAFSDLTEAQRKLAFRDSKHQNIIGATYISRFWAEKLTDIVE